MRNDLPAGGLHKGEGLPIGKRDKSSCSLSSVREHYTKRAGKARVSEARLSIRLCGFKQSAMPRTAGVSGNVPEEKEIKNAGSPVDCPQDKWKLLIGIQSIRRHFVTETVTCQFPVCHR